MSHTYFIKRRFHVGYSFLGRFLRRRIPDTYHAEGVFIVVFALLFIGLVLANYLGWALVEPVITSNPDGPITDAFWISQILTALTFFFLSAYGFKPALKISIDEGFDLAISQGKTSMRLPLAEIKAVTMISALRYHQHYRKYRETRAFYGKIPQTLLLIKTADGPILLGLDETSQQELLQLLQPQSEKIVFSTFSPIV